MATMDVYGTWVAHIVTALVLWHIVALFGSSPWLRESCEAGAGGRGSAHLWPGKRVSPPYLGRLEMPGAGQCGNSSQVGLQVGLKWSKFPPRFDLVQMPQLATCVWTRHEHTQPVACASLILRLQTAWVWLMIFNGRCAK